MVRNFLHRESVNKAVHQKVWKAKPKTLIKEEPTVIKNETEETTKKGRKRSFSTDTLKNNDEINIETDNGNQEY